METETRKTGQGGPGRCGMKAGARKAPVPGSEEARKMAAVVLEVMSGARCPNEASQALGISPMRYYAMEDRALQGIVAALEPRPRGRRKASPQDAVLQAERERDLMRRELGRTQALLRLVRKSVKLCEPGEEKGKAGKRRRKQKPARTGRLVARLRTPPEAEGRADA